MVVVVVQCGWHVFTLKKMSAEIGVANFGTCRFWRPRQAPDLADADFGRLKLAFSAQTGEIG